MDFGELEDPVAHVEELCGGRGPDVVIDAVGLEADGSPMHILLGRRMAQCNTRRYMPKLLEHHTPHEA